MAMRYSRRRADGLVEYSDSKEQLAASASQESEDSRQGCFALVGLVLGALVTLIFLHVHAMGCGSWPPVSGSESGATELRGLGLMRRCLRAIDVVTE